MCPHDNQGDLFFDSRLDDALEDLEGRQGLAVGRRLLEGGLHVLVEKPIASGIAEAMHREGAELALTYQNDKLKPRVEGMAAELGSKMTYPLDVGSDEEIDATMAAIALRRRVIDRRRSRRTGSRRAPAGAGHRRRPGRPRAGGRPRRWRFRRRSGGRGRTRGRTLPGAGRDRGGGRDDRPRVAGGRRGQRAPGGPGARRRGPGPSPARSPSTPRARRPARPPRRVARAGSAASPYAARASDRSDAARW